MRSAHVWQGWSAESGTRSAVQWSLTWDQWCQAQQLRLGSESSSQDGSSFSDRQRARLAFVRWLLETGRLAHGEPSKPGLLDASAIPADV
jgi:hypothetical protein